MSVYDYIAQRNPKGSVKVLADFGYRIADPRNMGNNLRLLVQKEGKPALIAILEMHPDKDVILEAFAAEQNPTSPEKPCGCKGCSENKSFVNADGAGGLTLKDILPGLNANTQASNDANKLASTNNAMIIAGALLISTLIFVNLKNK